MPEDVLTKKDVIMAKEAAGHLYNVAEELTDDQRKKGRLYREYQRVFLALSKAEELLGAFDEQALKALKGLL